MNLNIDERDASSLTRRIAGDKWGVVNYQGYQGYQRYQRYQGY